jgi:hypothetical protein
MPMIDYCLITKKCAVKDNAFLKGQDLTKKQNDAISEYMKKKTFCLVSKVLIPALIIVCAINAFATYKYINNEANTKLCVKNPFLGIK